MIAWPVRSGFPSVDSGARTLSDAQQAACGPVYGSGPALDTRLNIPDHLIGKGDDQLAPVRIQNEALQERGERPREVVCESALDELRCKDGLNVGSARVVESHAMRGRVLRKRNHAVLLTVVHPLRRVGREEARGADELLFETPRCEASA